MVAEGWTKDREAFWERIALGYVVPDPEPVEAWVERLERELDAQVKEVSQAE